MRLRGHALAALFDEVVTPALHQVGEQWEKEHLSIAEEHVASQAVIEAVARSQPLAEPPGEPVRADRGTAIVAAVAGELHDIAARMVACLLRAQGFEVLAPLAQTPARDLADLILRARAAIVALSSTMSSEVGEQVAMATAAARQTGGRVIVGGEGMRKARLPPEARLLASMRELDTEAQDAGRRRARG
jgi:methanogenic corrinoid protein MtbC1